MKKKRKYIKLCSSAAVLVICAIIAGRYFFGEKEQGIQESYSEMPYESYTEQGVYYSEDGFLSFANPVSGKRVLLCNIAGCTHRSDECGAAFKDAMVNGVSIMGDKLVYASNEGVQDKTGYFIYTSDFNGRNRKKLTFIPDIEYVSGCMVLEGKMIICYENSWDENNRELETPEAGIYFYDLKKKQGAIIYRRKNQNVLISRVQQMEDGLVFSEYYNDLSKEEIADNASDEQYIKKHSHANLVYVSCSGKEQRTLSENVALASYLKVNEKLVYYVKENAIFQCDIKGEEKKLSYSVQEKESISMIPNFGEKGILIRKYQQDSGKRGMEYFNPENGKHISYGESEVTVVAQYPAYTYVFVPKEGNDLELVAGYIRTDDMKKKNWEKVMVFGTEYQQQLEG